MNEVEPDGSGTAARTLARLALLCLAGVVAAVVAAGQWLLPLLGLVGIALAGAGIWWALAHRGVARLCGALLAVAAPVAVLVLYAVSGVWPFAAAALGLWAAALACERSALRRLRAPRGMHSHPVRPPRRPVLIMNPLSGGGKVTEHGLVEQAEALGARVILLDVDNSPDPAARARQAVAEGADLLGVAGGDGTQALVAAVAAEHDVPFVVLAAGTRNHFAMDLGLDRADPAAGLAALEDGVELRIDLGDINGRVFVNNASFGAYANVVQSPAYRDDKRGTTLNMLPDLLGGQNGPRLVACLDGTRTIEAPAALLVSNNPYELRDLAGLGRRYRLDRGELGVVAVTVHSAARAAEQINGTRSKGLHALTAREIVIDADVDEIPVG